ATELIAPEQVRGAWWTKPRGKDLCIGIVRRELTGEDGDEDRGEQDGAADDDALIADHAEHQTPAARARALDGSRYDRDRRGDVSQTGSAGRRRHRARRRQGCRG